MKRLLLPALFSLAALPGRACGDERLKAEAFDKDPGWQGVNHRSARELPPITIRQDFGYSETNHAGGARGEIGGFITPAGEAAYYAKAIQPLTLNDALSASGTFSAADGAFNLLLGFFNAGSVNEWRTPSSLALRINGRGDHLFAYVEYCTSRWRAGGDTTPFPSKLDPATGRQELIGFPSGGRVHRWSLAYDPAGNGGRGVIAATIDGQKAECLIDEGHRDDGATFNRFGLLTVIKSVDTGGELFVDDVTINGVKESFDRDPKWDGKNHRNTYASLRKRPRFDFGYSPTSFAGGKAKGELGGMIFRGDCRHAGSLAAYGDVVGPLTLDRPLRASGKVAMTRGVTDSTVLFGFYNSSASLRRNDSQASSIPEDVLGIHIEGPSSEGFCFYPVCRPRGAGGLAANPRECPRIYPDGASHDWTFEYDPEAAGGKGRITVTLDGRRGTLDLEPGARASGTVFDRFGIVTTWIDGNSQDVYWDDLEYTATH